MPPGRPKSFVEEEVLEKIMTLFWRHGYRGVGMAEITSYTGLARQSLYNTFGNKRELLLKALTYYYKHYMESQLKLLEDSPSPLKALQAFLLAPSKVNGKHPPGCFCANMLVETGADEPVIGASLNQIYAAVEASLRKTIARAQKAGEIPEQPTARARARAILVSSIGASAMHRLPGSETLWRDAAKTQQRLLCA